eukprot:9551205-Alexandrium_andersonii.AAC.1
MPVRTYRTPRVARLRPATTPSLGEAKKHCNKAAKQLGVHPGGSHQRKPARKRHTKSGSEGLT